jgi:hypothetical protein
MIPLSPQGRKVSNKHLFGEIIKDIMWLKTKGILEFDNTIIKLKKEPSKTLIVKLADDDLDIYYQWFVTQQCGQSSILQRPMFGTHVSVIRRYEVKDLASLYLLNGRTIELQYSVELEKIHQFWCLPVISDELNDIRINYGLAPVTNLHITIGRKYDWQD